MKKTGFTLAEILIALGIVGIIAAITVPTFTAQTQRSKIGPKLGKSVASFEQATRMILDDAQVDRLNRITAETGGTCGTTTLANSGCMAEYLGHHMKGAMKTHGNGSVSFYSTDGTEYQIPMYSAPSPAETSPYAHNRRFFGAPIMIDINGQQGPGADAKDIFYFQLMEDGSLRPRGGSWEAISDRWSSKCKKDEKPTDPSRCAGHIMENGLKAEYKL